MRINKAIASIFSLSSFFIAVMAMGGVVSAQSGQAGTTLSATKTAEGYYERRIEYDWGIQKVASPTSMQINPGQDGTVTYTITATKNQVSQTDVFGVRGEVCVTNGGDRTTEGLQIVDQVEYKVGSGQFQPLAGATQTINPAQLGPGESQCYPYDIQLTPVAGAEYRNVAHVTITNHSGWRPGGNNCPGPEVCPFGPDPKAGFSIPTDPTIIEIDENAVITDVLTCPAGFTCTREPTTSMWSVTGPVTITYTVNVHNDSVACGQNANLTNIATLVEGDTLQSHTANATVNIYTGVCVTPTPTPVLGCSHTIGYWKTHTGLGKGNQQDEVTQYLPIRLGTAGGAKTVTVTNVTQAVTILNKAGDASNGMNKLYAQLLGTKLSIADGADGSAVASAIAAADAFLANYNANDWKTMTTAQKNMVLAWASTFDSFNNGVIGPGHCN